MAVLVNYISELIKENKSLRKEMNCIYAWCKRRRMNDNAAVITACVVEVTKYVLAIAITAAVSTLMLIAILIMF